MYRNQGVDYHANKAKIPVYNRALPQQCTESMPLMRIRNQNNTIDQYNIGLINQCIPNDHANQIGMQMRIGIYPVRN